MERACVIFCAGEMSGPVEVPEGALVIAADGGYRHTRALGLSPQVVLGDFDSLGYVPEGEGVLRHPVRKDDTDAMLALRLGLERGCRVFYIYGGLRGPRLDHTMANYQALEFLADHGGQGYLMDEDVAVTVLKEETVRFSPRAEGTFSLLCLGGEARGVTLQNVLYPLENAVLTAGFPLGVSNHFVGKEGEIRVEKGSLLAFFPRSACEFMKRSLEHG